MTDGVAGMVIHFASRWPESRKQGLADQAAKVPGRGKKIDGLFDAAGSRSPEREGCEDFDQLARGLGRRVIGKRVAS